MYPKINTDAIKHQIQLIFKQNTMRLSRNSKTFNDKSATAAPRIRMARSLALSELSLTTNALLTKRTRVLAISNCDAIRWPTPLPPGVFADSYDNTFTPHRRFFLKGNLSCGIFQRRAGKHDAAMQNGQSKSSLTSVSIS